MLVRLTYFLVILIWATSPLAIKLGGDSLPPMAALSLRTALAFLLGCALCTLTGVANLNIKRHWQIYLAASISLFPNMALVYISAQYISSGLIALLFGMTPFFTAVLARPILGEKLLSPRKILALCLACIGLTFILVDDSNMTGNSAIGILLMLGSNLLFSISALWVKKLNRTIKVDPIEQTLGAMAFALPGMFISWVFIVGLQPLSFSSLSLASLLYLTVFGSLLGFVAYYYILNHMSIESVSLIPLITPIIAMALGNLIAHEQISLQMVTGTGLILLALSIHQGFRYNRIFKAKTKR